MSTFTKNKCLKMFKNSSLSSKNDKDKMFEGMLNFK